LRHNSYLCYDVIGDVNYWSVGVDVEALAHTSNASVGTLDASALLQLGTEHITNYYYYYYYCYYY